VPVFEGLRSCAMNTSGPLVGREYMSLIDDKRIRQQQLD